MEIAFHNTGLYNVDGRGSYPPPNTGVHAVTGDLADMGRFKAPTLRNIALTAPYMHDGSVRTLDEVLSHYAAGGRRVTQGPTRGDGSKSPLKSRFITGFTLTPGDRTDLIAFLNSLTDELFIKDPRFSNPMGRSEVRTENFEVRSQAQRSEVGPGFPRGADPDL